MRINQNTTIIGSKVILVPYCKAHVPRYNEFMQSEELQKLTASEPLTLEDEYEMQQSWLNDEDKCTFILLDKERLLATKDEISSMIGDTNLYIMEKENDDITAEISIMIADSDARGKRFGWEATLIMLNYGTEVLGVKHFVAKISTSNIKSLKMFEKINFKQESVSDVFQEVTMTLKVDEDWLKWLREEMKDAQTYTNLESYEFIQ